MNLDKRLIYSNVSYFGTEGSKIYLVKYDKSFLVFFGTWKKSCMSLTRLKLDTETQIFTSHMQTYIHARGYVSISHL